MRAAICLIIVPNWEQPKRLTGEWLNKLFAYPNNGIFLRNKTEWVHNTCNSIDELQKHYAELKKYDTYIVCFHSYATAKEAKGIDSGREPISGCLG